MDIRILALSSPVRICFDAPFLDGIENIKTAFQPKITCAFQRMSLKDHVVDLSQRGVQIIACYTLLIPGINIAIDFALRMFSRMDRNGTYLPSKTEMPPHLDERVLKSVLPQMLHFLRENG